MDSDLARAFRFHLQKPMPQSAKQGFVAPIYQGRDYSMPDDGKGFAALALARARADVAAGKTRYPGPIKGNPMRAGFDHDIPGSVYIESPESHGLRLVGRVYADTPRGEIWDNHDQSGWFDNPFGESFKDGSGLIYGLVYQLPGRKGQARFVAAYQNGCNDSGALFDFSRIYAEPAAWFEPVRKTSTGTYGGYWNFCDNPREMDSARDAARHADSLAQKAAELEREYQAAWQAGAQWADAQGEVTQARKEALAILTERRAAKGQEAFPALCAAIRAQVESLRETIQEARERAHKLASGDAEPLFFYNGDKRLREAFNEGAGESVLS